MIVNLRGLFRNRYSQRNNELFYRRMEDNELKEENMFKNKHKLVLGSKTLPK